LPLQLISKTALDKERIMLALAANFMFKTLEPALCDAIVNAMEAYNVSAGTEVTHLPLASSLPRTTVF
jgi:hypothetical protein